MNEKPGDFQHLIAELAQLIEQGGDPEHHLYTIFLQHPDYALKLIDYLDDLDESVIHQGSNIYSACVFGLDVCVAQLQTAKEANSKNSAKLLELLMNHLAGKISNQKHTLSFWLPILNAFYEVHVELTDQLKNAYFELASYESEQLPDDQQSHLDSIRDLIHELSDLSIFDITENLFAQSYAMPPDFFADLIVDLYSIEEGQDIALLILLHPKAEVREIAIEMLDQLLDKLTLSSISLSRLQSIMYWYPESYRPTFNRWIKNQRKKGVVFQPEPQVSKMEIKATEVDGTGAQGLFIHLREKYKKNRLCGLLIKNEQGIKDAWVTPEITSIEVSEYYSQAFDESVTIRQVDLSYLVTMVEHFLYVTLSRFEIPNLYFLEIQEILGVHFRPNPIDAAYLIDQLSIQITPFTQEVILDSLNRSKNWLKNKEFTESWYIENPLIDKIVNHNCSFIDGVKICKMEEAMTSVFAESMERHRDQWIFHFLWVALWFKAKARKNEKMWVDSFLIAYSIHIGTPLQDIPVLKEICRQTVINSVETMEERRTHLSKE